MVLPGVWDTLSHEENKWIAEFGVQLQIIIIILIIIIIIIIIIIVPFDGATGSVRYVVPWW